METPLKSEFKYYLANQDEMVKKYNGKFIVLKDKKVLGSFDSQMSAISEMKKQGHEIGTFLIQKVEPGEGAYSQTFHSRVAFH
jgi:hypothetical protein